MPRPPGHAAGLTAGYLATQALTLANEQGLEALTVRGLARRVGVEPMSIYNYFPNKDTLFDAVWEEVLTQTDLPRDQSLSWQSYIRELAHRLRSAVLRHPNVLPIMLGRQARTSRSLDLVDNGLADLTARGLPLATAIDLFNSICMFVMAHALNEHLLAAAEPPAINRVRNPTLAAALDAGFGEAPGDDVRRFSLAIEAFIAGFGEANA